MKKDEPTTLQFLNDVPPVDDRRLNAMQEETIDIGGLFAEGMSLSGSFDLRGFRVSSFGKLLDAIPIPALLVDKAQFVIFANQACKKISANYQEIQGSRFGTLFPDAAIGTKAEEMVGRVFSHRLPLVSEGVLGVGKKRIWGRMHLRSIRIQKERSVLVIIEDITLAKKQMLRRARKAAASQS
jgi:nitrogen-specific signal transduction histidine kinase